MNIKMNIKLKAIIKDIQLNSDGCLDCNSDVFSELTGDELAVISGGSINGGSCTNSGTCGSSSKNSVCSNTGNCSGSTNGTCLEVPTPSAPHGE